jgi:hypothetical protein
MTAWSKKKRVNNPPFVQLPWKMLNSQAYKDLPPSPAKALPYFLGKVKRNQNDPYRYTDEFSFSYTEGKKLGFAPATFSKAIQALVTFGFVDPVDKGGLRGDSKSCNLFKLSTRWEAYGAKNFQSVDWRCFTPREDRFKI